MDKPDGMTSHDVVSRARRSLNTRKVGHAGTLDPMATGLLLLGVGSSTRLLTYLVGLGKRYAATIRLGVSTDTAIPADTAIAMPSIPPCGSSSAPSASDTASPIALPTSGW